MNKSNYRIQVAHNGNLGLLFDHMKVHLPKKDYFVYHLSKNDVHFRADVYKGKNSSSDKFVARIDFNKTGWLEEKIIVRLDGNLTPTIINTINAGVMGYVVKYHGHIK